MHNKLDLIHLLAPEERSKISEEMVRISLLRAFTRAYDELNPLTMQQFQNLFTNMEDSLYTDQDRMRFLFDHMPNFPKYMIEEAVLLRKELANTIEQD